MAQNLDLTLRKAQGHITFKSSLNGVWSTDCLQGRKKIQVIKVPRINTFELFYKDAQCEKLTFYFLNQGVFTTNQYTMDFQFTKVYLNIRDPKILQSFNQQSMCDISKWQKNMNTEITGRWCNFFSSNKKTQVPNKNEFRYGIYKLDGAKLFFGKLDNIHTALTPNTRPTQWDPIYYTKLQNQDNL